MSKRTKRKLGWGAVILSVLGITFLCIFCFSNNAYAEQEYWYTVVPAVTCNSTGGSGGGAECTVTAAYCTKVSVECGGNTCPLD